MAKKQKKKTKKKNLVPRAMLWVWLRRVGLTLSVLIVIGWLGSWFFLTRADQKIINWVDQKILSTTSDMGFVVQEILVEGLDNTDSDILKALINIEKGDPLFALRPREAKDLIERISWVRAAHIERRFPGTIYIRLTERQPTAFWQKNKKLKLLDERGEIISTENMDRFKDLMIVIGDEAPKHLPDLAQSLVSVPEVYERVTSASWVGGRRWDVVIKSDITVKLPEGSVDEALRRLADAQDADKLMDKDIKVIDLREDNRIVVRTRPGQAVDYIKGNSI